MSKLLKKEIFYFGGHKLDCRVQEEKGHKFLQIDVKRNRKLIDWIEVPLEEK